MVVFYGCAGKIFTISLFFGKCRQMSSDEDDLEGFKSGRTLSKLLTNYYYHLKKIHYSWKTAHAQTRIQMRFKNTAAQKSTIVYSLPNKNTAFLAPPSEALPSWTMDSLGLWTRR
jgi:hypothetical protein